METFYMTKVDAIAYILYRQWLTANREIMQSVMDSSYDDAKRATIRKHAQRSKWINFHVPGWEFQAYIRFSLDRIIIANIGTEGYYHPDMDKDYVPPQKLGRVAMIYEAMERLNRQMGVNLTLHWEKVLNPHIERKLIEMGHEKDMI